MKINLTPQVRNDSLTVVKKGDALTINGDVYDFTQLPNGGLLPQESIDCKWITGDVKRVNNEIELTLILSCKHDSSEAARFPQPIINPPDGEIQLPL